jgi:GTPase SAR1 family protein
MSEEEVFFKVIILGKVGVGKTSLLQRYCKGNFNSSYKCTIGTDILTKTLMIDDGRRKVVLQVIIFNY